MASRGASIHISATIKKSGAKPTMKMQLIRFIVSVLGCYGSSFIFITGFNLDVSKPLVMAVIVLCCLFTNVYNLKKNVAYCSFGITSLACVAASAALKYEYAAGFAAVMNRYMESMDSEYKANPYIPVIEPELSGEHMAVFIVLSVAFLCLLTGLFFLSSSPGLYTIFFLIFPPILVFIMGLEPSELSFSAFVVSITALAAYEFTVINSVTGQQFSRYSMQCMAVASITAAICLAFVFGFVKITNYERSEKVNRLFDRAEAYIDRGEFYNDFAETFSFSDDHVFYGAINHGKLDEFGNIRFKFIDMLQVTMPRPSDTVYLRGYVGSVYTGRSWENLPASKLRELEEITDSFTTEGLSSLLFDSYNLKSSPNVLPNYSFTVKNLAAKTDHLYMPYNLVPESVSRYSIVDNSYFIGNETTWFGQIYDPDSYYGYQNLFRKRWSIPSSLVDDEAAYRNFVYENYLELPESFSPEEIFNQSYYEYITAEEVQTGKSTLDEMTVFSRKLYYIKNWLRDNCSYSLTTEPLSKGEDFVNHFLEHKEGSCTHFASTAVLMCRYAGIPARYVEGFIITPYDTDLSVAAGTTVTFNVQDTQGHAWVEIYIDGYGWYPMEFTSGYGNVRTSSPTETIAAETEPAVESEQEIANETASDNENATTYTAPQPQEEVTSVRNNQQEQTVTTVPKESISESSNATEIPNESNAPKSVGFGIFGIQGDKKVDVVYDLTWLLVAVLIIVAVPVALILRRMIITSSRSSASSPAEQVNADYKRFCRLLELMEMPKQGGMSYSEYGEELEKRSELLADGVASRIIGFALKASFGGDCISRDEAHEMRLEVTSLIKRYCGTLSAFGKFKVKFIYCLI